MLKSQWLKSHWLITICIFILVLFAIFGIAWFIRNKSKLNNKTSQYSNPILWSDPEPASNEDSCYLYQFPSITQTVIDGTGPNTINIILPGLPTLNPAVLDNIPIGDFKKLPPTKLRCIDSDQILAREGKQVCENVKSKNTDSVNFCTSNNGINAASGDEQFFYYNDSEQSNGQGTCPSLRPCNGEISLISINNDPTEDNNYAIGCITKITDDNVILSPCAANNDDLSKQLFRLTRINYGEDPYASEDGQGSLTGQNGIFGQILDRENNYCLRRTATTGSDCIIFGTCHGGSYTGPSGTIGVGGPRAGFNWLFFPTLGGNSQQLLYIGDTNMYDFKDIYLGLTGYTSPDGKTFPPGTESVIAWLYDNNVPSIAAPICCTSYLYLKKSLYDITMQDQIRANYYNISNFNLLRKLPACKSGEAQNIIECLGL
jgi:hypothetical protein